MILFFFFAPVPSAEARSLQPDRPVVYSTSTGAVRYWNGSTLTQIATNGYGVSYWRGKFMWWNDTYDRWDYVSYDAPTTIRTYLTPVTMSGGTLNYLTTQNPIQWTDYGVGYVSQDSID